MQEELYRQALTLFNNGDYEAALGTLKKDRACLSSAKGKQLAEQCEKLITEQYCYLINEAIRQGDPQNARLLKQRYNLRYGSNQRIESIEIPEPTQSTDNQQSGGESAVSSNRLWAIAGIVAVLAFIGWLYWQYNRDVEQAEQQREEATAAIQETPKSGAEVFSERANAVIAQLTAEYGDKVKIIGTYPELSQYVVGYIEDFSPESFHCLVVCDNKAQEIKYYHLKDGDTILKRPIKAWEAGDKLLLIMQENNQVEIEERISYELVRINTANWKLSEICAGYNIRMEGDRVVVSLYGTTAVDENYHYSYCNVDVCYGLNGDIIKPEPQGDTFQLKGLIDNQYAVTMRLYLQDNKFSGEYYYDRNGSKDVLYLYGGISPEGGVALLEFTDKGRHTSSFRGRFNGNVFSGTFVNYQDKEMPFELSLNDDVAAASDTGSDTRVPDRDAEFPGGLTAFGQYILDNRQYPPGAKERGVEGNVRVSYIIDTDGSIIDAKVIESADPDLDAEALRLIRLMPKWKPGIRDNKPVKMRTNTVIKFELN